MNRMVFQAVWTDFAEATSLLLCSQNACELIQEMENSGVIPEMALEFISFLEIITHCLLWK